jgi:hypothetical protein
MELAIWASFILQFRVRNRAGGGDDLRGGDIATENARLGATGPIDLLDTENSPIDMPAPMIVQPRYQTARLGANASTAWPAAITTMLVSNAPRPPCRSIHLPTAGAPAPATSSAHENAPRTRNPD